MASDQRDDQHKAMRVVEELEQRGAEDPTIQGNMSVAKYTAERDHPKATHTVEYVGEPEMVRHTCQALDRVHLLGATTDAWPGGALAVTAEIAITGHIGVLDGGSGGTNPRGNAADSTSAAVPPPENENEQNPHVPPGGLYAVQDEHGFHEQYDVEAWPVRWWEPRPDVPAVLVLRYVPYHRAQGLEWWAGYCRLAGDSDRADRVLERVREKRIHPTGREVDVTWHGGPVNVDWYGSNWVGWSEATLASEAHGVPVVHSGPKGWMENREGIGNQAAGELTTALAQAVREARREVLPQ